MINLMLFASKEPSILQKITVFFRKSLNIYNIRVK
jgi:hypothetical protein